MIAVTQDQYGQAPGTGYVRGEVVPDDETGALEADQSGPMTRLRKVASAFRGERADETVSDPTAPASPDTADPNGSWSAHSAGPGAMSSPVAEEEIDDGEYRDATRPNDVGAVRSPETGERDYWDDETAPGGGMAATDTSADTTAAARTHAEDATASYPSTTGGSAYGTPGPAGTDALAPDYGSQASIPTDPPMPAGAGLSGAGLSGTGLSGTGLSGTGEDIAAGKHAAAADAGLRPGEATDRIGDFGDIAFGNLLPDAEQYSAQWQQIQFRFVDDPQGSVTEAADVLSQVTAKLEAAIQERQRAIEERKQAIQERASALRGRWGEGSNADTETLRETLRMYRAFMDQLIGPMS